MQLQIRHLTLLVHHVCFNVSAVAIEDVEVVVVSIRIFSVDKVEWAYGLVGKVELEVCFSVYSWK